MPDLEDAPCSLKQKSPTPVYGIHRKDVLFEISIGRIIYKEWSGDLASCSLLCVLDGVIVKPSIKRV